MRSGEEVCGVASGVWRVGVARGGGRRAGGWRGSLKQPLSPFESPQGTPGCTQSKHLQPAVLVQRGLLLCAAGLRRSEHELHGHGGAHPLHAVLVVRRGLNREVPTQGRHVLLGDGQAQPESIMPVARTPAPEPTTHPSQARQCNANHTRSTGGRLSGLIHDNLKGEKKQKDLRNADRKDRSRGCSLLPCHGTFSTSKVGGWRLAVGGWLVGFGGGWWLAVGGWGVDGWRLPVGGG